MDRFRFFSLTLIHLLSPALFAAMTCDLATTPRDHLNSLKWEKANQVDAIYLGEKFKERNIEDILLSKRDHFQELIYTLNEMSHHFGISIKNKTEKPTNDAYEISFESAFVRVVVTRLKEIAELNPELIGEFLHLIETCPNGLFREYIFAKYFLSNNVLFQNEVKTPIAELILEKDQIENSIKNILKTPIEEIQQQALFENFSNSIYSISSNGKGSFGVQEKIILANEILTRKNYELSDPIIKNTLAEISKLPRSNTAANLLLKNALKKVYEKIDLSTDSQFFLNGIIFEKTLLLRDIDKHSESIISIDFLILESAIKRNLTDIIDYFLYDIHEILLSPYFNVSTNLNAAQLVRLLSTYFETNQAKEDHFISDIERRSHRYSEKTDLSKDMNNFSYIWKHRLKEAAQQNQ